MTQRPVYPAKLYSSTNAFFVTADAVVFTLDQGVLKVLLIKRKDYPFEGQWAIPGGFVNGHDSSTQKGDSDIQDACKRELQEETGVENPYIEQMFTYTKKGRDPREEDADIPTRIFSVSHLCCLKMNEVSPKASDDAEEVQWVPVEEALKMNLAFDHDQALKEAFDRYSKNPSYYDTIMQEPFWSPILIGVAVVSFVLGFVAF